MESDHLLNLEFSVFKLGWVALPPFKSGVQSGGLLGFTAPAQKAGDNCGQGSLCAAPSAVLVVPLPRLSAPSDSPMRP